jgi:DNA invertase Pin-like site-specific DNA recombinase
VLIAPIAADERLTTAHRAKLAYVYVRQSSLNQVRQHQESTQLQYRLVDRAIGLGWPHERVQVIDEDLGKSGAGSIERHGFQKLIAEIGLGNAGLVVSLDASRLARNNRDWHQLLELCSVFGVLIADGERLYDPRAYHDRLLLGLSGIMSEAELHQIRMRLHQGERQKAARGELRLPLPAGLAHDRGGMIILNPDEEVQARLLLVFAKFRELQSARGVMRFLCTSGLPLPVRPILGPAPHDVVWREADSARVRNILQNPAYAGAYVYGRRQKDPSRCLTGSSRGTVKVAVGEWAVCLQAAHPGYIGWEEFMANQRRLADNVNRYEAGHTGAPRRGAALLQGIAVCAVCVCATRARMVIIPFIVVGSIATYEAARCVRKFVRCRSIRSSSAYFSVRWLRTRSRSQSRRWDSWRRRVGNLSGNGHCDANALATRPNGQRRQYDAVEPENRLVARSLERSWEDKLRAVEAIEQEYQRWRSEEPLVIGEAERAALQSLGENLPQIWHAATTLPADRKRILRFVVQEVVLDQKRAPGQVWLKIVWKTGATSEHRLQRRVHTYRDYIDLGRLRRRITELNSAGKMDKEIAAILNQEGLVAARGCVFKDENVWLLRKRWNIPTVKINGDSANPMRWPDGSFSIQGVAAVLGVTTQTVFDYIARGLVAGHQLTKGQPWQIDLSDEQISQLRARVRRTKRSKKEAS